MSKKLKWVGREFDFSFPANVYPGIIKRLKETPHKLEKSVIRLPEKLLKEKQNNKWSIQENAGHLITVESLFMGRLDDYEQNKPALRPADVTGSRTDNASYNEQEISEILIKFRKMRKEFVKRLDSLSPEDFSKTAFHPRLKKTMRLVDMLYFIAEHDDHHLQRITEIKSEIE